MIKFIKNPKTTSTGVVFDLEIVGNNLNSVFQGDIVGLQRIINFCTICKDIIKK
jgi:hypothetical protein